MALDADGSDQLKLAVAPRGTNQVTLPALTYVGSRRTFLVYAENNAGRAPSGSAAAFNDRTGAEGPPTTTVTSTTRTSTTTTIVGGSDVITNVAYSDTNSEAYILEGIVSWTPPSPSTGVLGYKVYLSYSRLDTEGLRAVLWERHSRHE